MARWRGDDMKVAALIVFVAVLVGCVVPGQPGLASSYLIVDALQAAAGAQPTMFGGTLGSDVQTWVLADGADERVPIVFEDIGQVALRLAMKDPAATAASANFITLTRYRVTFRRADGRNTPGVDVPYAFDGAMTVTVGAEPVLASFALVRIQAKSEAPLRALIGGGGAIVISTLADVTFYGADQAGRAVTAAASIGVTFADWHEP